MLDTVWPCSVSTLTTTINAAVEQHAISVRIRYLYCRRMISRRNYFFMFGLCIRKASFQVSQPIFTVYLECEMIHPIVTRH